MNKQASNSGSNAEQFFSRARIRPEESGLIDPKFSEGLLKDLSSRHLHINGEYAPESMKEKIIFLFKHKPLLGFLSGFAAFMCLFVVGMLVVPSFRDQVNLTAAKFFGKEEKKQEQQEDIKGLDFEEEVAEFPELKILSPENGGETVEGTVHLKGSVDAGSKLTVNGVEITLNEGLFDTTIPVELGENKLVFVVTSAEGKSVTKELVVIRKEPVAEAPKTTSTPKPTQKPANTSGSISLSGVKVDNGIKLDWSVSNLDVSKGFKVVWSKDNPNPVYPGNNYAYLDNSGSRSYTFSKKDGKTYYFRVCQYLGGSCGKYSNSVQVTAPSAPAFSVTGLTLSDAGGFNVSWSVTGNPVNGYKLLWSTTDETPDYPGAEGAQYYGSDATSGSVSGSGTVYVRICAKNNEGGCFYSNAITKTLP